VGIFMDTVMGIIGGVPVQADGITINEFRLPPLSEDEEYVDGGREGD